VKGKVKEKGKKEGKKRGLSHRGGENTTKKKDVIIKKK